MYATKPISEVRDKLYAEAPSAFTDQYSAYKYAEALYENRPDLFKKPDYDPENFTVEISENCVDIYYDGEQIDFWNL